jgi:hypothetical protein
MSRLSWAKRETSRSRKTLFTRDAQDGGIVGRATVGIREANPQELVTGLGFEGGCDGQL